MGCYDSVITKCPSCGLKVDFQSKAGDCGMEEFDINSVDPVVAYDLSGTIQKCKDCGHVIKIEALNPTQRVAMKVSDVGYLAEEN